MPQHNGFGHVTLTVSDLDRSADFYNRVFSAQTVDASEDQVGAVRHMHAIVAVVDEALAAKEEGAERVILFSYSGHGLLDLGAYDAYLQVT